jgi:hypothetical protein
MSLLSLLLLFLMPGLLLLLVVAYTVRNLCQGYAQPLPDRTAYAWRYPGTVLSGVVHCYHCHCSRLGKRSYGGGQQLHYCSLCGTDLFVS